MFFFIRSEEGGETATTTTMEAKEVAVLEEAIRVAEAIREAARAGKVAEDYIAAAAVCEARVEERTRMLRQRVAELLKARSET